VSRPLIAILRGITPDECKAIGGALMGAGIERVEVPLNSPSPFESIKRLAEYFGDRAEIGAGTVLTPKDVEKVAGVGGRMVVSPNTDANVIAKTKALGMVSYPGVLTPSECFSALAAGADALKVFPAVMMGLDGLRAIRAVLPPEVRLYMVGGVGPEDFAIWLKAGASGFGLGSALYKPGRNAAEVARLARLAVAAWDACEKP